MPRTLTLALTCLTLSLVLFPLAAGKPGLPPNLKADEPAYYLMAMSLALDQDLRCDPQDTRRLFDEFPYMPVRNLIVMTDDDWETVYYGKPYIYSLLAAPFAGLFGGNGMLAFNMLLYCGMIWMAVAYLRKYNPDHVALTFALGFFLLSSSWTYVFWLHPEIFMMTSAMASLFLIFYPFDVDDRGWWARLAPPGMRPFWAAAILACGAYHKPQLAAFALPVLYVLFKREGLRGIGRWVAGGAVASVLLCGFALWQTGHPSAYLGVQRAGPSVYHAGQSVVPPEKPMPKKVTESGERRELTDTEVKEELEVRKTANSWQWMFRIPDFSLSRLIEEGGYFFWGRHTGLFVYMPFTLVALLLFFFSRRDPEPLRRARWWILGSLGLMALFNMLWIPHNWHGGGGFVGNRYYVIAYPAFLFLIRHIRPQAILFAGYAAGALLTGPLFFTPFGAPVPNPTLQAHVRNFPTRLFPFEFALRGQIPGYLGVPQNELWWDARKDVFKGHGEEMWFQGGTTVETWVKSNAPVGKIALIVKSLAPINHLVLKSSAQTVELGFDRDPATQPEAALVELELGKPVDVREKNSITTYTYRLFVTSKTGEHRPASTEVQRFYVGAAITYIGPPDFLEADLYDLQWGPVETPRNVLSEETFALDVAVFNQSPHHWMNEGPARVKMSYRWLDEAGDHVFTIGPRSEINRRVPPKKPARVNLQVLAPKKPGLYTLEIDLLLEHVTWFGERNDDGTLRRKIRVLRSHEKASEEAETVGDAG